VSEIITVKFGQIIIGSNEGPVGILPIEIKIVDKEGEVIVEDSSTQFKVTLIEANPNNTASSDAEEEFVVLSNGKTNIEVTDSESEVVDIDAEAEPEMAVLRGEAVYGTIGDRGIRIRFWRERD